MASRSPRSARKNRRKEPTRPAVAESMNLTLWDALLMMLDPPDSAELQRLKAKGFGHMRIYVGPDPKRDRHDELLARGEGRLRAHLSSGAWFLSGYRLRARADEPRVSMRPDRAPHATFDYDALSVTVGGDQLTEVVVSTRPVLSLSRSRSSRRGR